MPALALDALNSGILRLDESGVIREINTAAVELLGLRDGPWLGRPAGEAPLPDTLHRWTERVRTGKQSMRVVETVFPEAPELEPMDIYIQPFEDGVLLELMPVAPRVRQRELLEQADRRRTLTRMLHTLAHELRNPLGGMRGAAQLIEQQAGDAAIARHARLISNQIDRVTGLIERFASDSDNTPDTVNIHRLLTEAADLVLAESGAGLEIERDFDPSIPEMTARPDALFQLFLNLLRNAGQAGAERVGLVTRFEQDSPLLAGSRRHAIRVDVEDDGRGVPEAVRERLFLPMVSGREGGTGFGLAVAQQIARRHGGLIEYAPLEPGSRFRVRIPLQPPDGEPVS